jgi:hypothetical protein
MRESEFEEQEFTPVAVLRVVTPNSVWLLTAHRYQRLPRREQVRGALVAIDGRLDDGLRHELHRCWWLIHADGARQVRILPQTGPEDGCGIVTGVVTEVHGEWFGVGDEEL